MLIQALRSNELAVVALSIAEELQRFVAAVTRKYPALQNCRGAMDGLKKTFFYKLSDPGLHHEDRPVPAAPLGCGATVVIGSYL